MLSSPRFLQLSISELIYLDKEFGSQGKMISFMLYLQVLQLKNGIDRHKKDMVILYCDGASWRLCQAGIGF